VTGAPEYSRLDPDPPRMRILVVDDMADNREGTAELIRLRGHDTQTAPSGPDAIQQITSFKPHLVLLDLAMPDMDGIDVAKAVRSLPDIEPPVIAALTGYGDEFNRQRCAESGFDYFLLKPVAANDYDYLLWITSEAARVRDAFSILQAEHRAAFFDFAVAQLEFGWLILNCAASQADALTKQRSLEKVRRMQDRTTKWLKMAGGFTPRQKDSLQTLLSGLHDRLTTMKRRADIN
jgi:CheY-like chemotaxis protein